MNPADAAITVYGELWQSLRAEAADLDAAARLREADYPLTADADRRAADYVRKFAAVAHRARYAEMLDPEPVPR